jgi:hypothetical protein
MNLVHVSFVRKKIISAVKRVEFISDRMSYIILRSRWCDIIVLNVHAPTEDKIDDIVTKRLKARILDSIWKRHFLGNKMGQNSVHH